MNPYEELGVPKSANEDEIRRAYRRLAQEFHPDRCPPEGDRVALADRMQKINRAYEILQDKAARARFDSTGEADPDPKQAALDHAISAMFTSLLNSPVDIEREDLMDLMERIAKQRELSLHNSIVELVKTARRRRRALRRILRTDGQENAIARALEKQIEQRDAEVENLRGDVEFVRRVIAELKNYSYSTGFVPENFALPPAAAESTVETGA